MSFNYLDLINKYNLYLKNINILLYKTISKLEQLLYNDDTKYQDIKNFNVILSLYLIIKSLDNF